MVFKFATLLRGSQQTADLHETRMWRMEVHQAVTTMQVCRSIGTPAWHMLAQPGRRRALADLEATNRQSIIQLGEVLWKNMRWSYELLWIVMNSYELLLELLWNESWSKILSNYEPPRYQPLHSRLLFTNMTTSNLITTSSTRDGQFEAPWLHSIGVIKVVSVSSLSFFLLFGHKIITFWSITIFILIIVLPHAYQC